VTDFVHIVGEVGTARQCLIGGKRIGITVASSDRDKVAGGNNSRALYQSLVNAIAERKLSIGKVGLAGVAQGSETVAQPDLEVVQAPERLLWRRHPQVCRG